MAAHRYWRAIGLEAYGLAGLDLTEFQLFAGTTRVDASATLTASVAPTVGSLANLKDDSTATGAAWPASAVPTLVLSWDFGGSPQDVSDIVLGSASDLEKFLLTARIQYSDDASAWSDLLVLTSIAAPPARAKTTSNLKQAAQILASSPALFYKFDETSGTAYADASGNGRTGAGTGTITQGGAGLSDDSLRSVLLAAGAVVAVADPLGAGYAGGFSIRALVSVATAANATIVGRGRDGFGAGWSISFGLSSAGALACTVVVAGAAYSASSAAGLYGFAGATIEVLTTYSPGRLAVYADGVLLASAAVPAGALRDSTVGLTIAQSNGTTNPGAMRIDEFAVWPYALSASQIKALSSGGKIAQTAGRVRPVSAIPLPTAASVPMGTVQVRTPIVFRGRNDYLTGILGKGIGRVRGTVVDKAVPTNTPVHRRVRLVREVDGTVVREAWSDPATGAYDFQYIDELQEYAVWSRDHLNNKQGVINDHLTLANGKVELMA